MVNTIKSITEHITNPHPFRKVYGILASAIALNLATPSTAGGPHTTLTNEQQNILLEHNIKQMKIQQINSSILCDTRQNFISYLKQHGYLRSYTYQDWLASLNMSANYKHKLDSLLQTLFTNPQQYPAAHRHLLNLIAKQMRKAAYADIKDKDQLNLINQLERILPHQTQSYHYFYVDPELVKFLDRSNIHALIELSKPKYIATKSDKVPLIVADTPDNLHDSVYIDNNIEKYSHTHAYKLLTDNNIGLRSSVKGTHEQGNSRSSTRTSLVGANKTSIDGVISLINNIRQRWGLTNREYITGGTELGSHSGGTNGHEGGRKLDIGESLLTLLILIEYNIDQVNTPYTVTIGDYTYTFRYHAGSHWHLDIYISLANTHRLKEIIEPIKPDLNKLLKRHNTIKRHLKQQQISPKSKIAQQKSTDNTHIST